MTHKLLSAGSLKNNSVQNMNGEDIGSIQEFMINPEQGNIEYAVLSFGGFMGMGDKYFAIPWQALEIDRNNEMFRLDITKEKLENSPGFDKNDWPDFGDSTFLHTVNRNYNGVGSFTYREQ